jgi:hypothetical protein
MKIDAELNLAEGSSLGRRHLRDNVTESMIGLWRRHVDSHATSQKIGSEIEKWRERSDTALEILESSLNGDNKNLLSHYFKLIRLTSCSEALLVELRSQVANLQVAVSYSILYNQDSCRKILVHVKMFLLFLSLQR